MPKPCSTGEDILEEVKMQKMPSSSDKEAKKPVKLGGLLKG